MMPGNHGFKTLPPRPRWNAAQYPINLTDADEASLSFPFMLLADRTEWLNYKVSGAILALLPKGEREFNDAVQRITAVALRYEAADAAVKAGIEKAQDVVDSLGGIRQILVTDTYVQLADVGREKRLIPSQHTTPNGYTLQTITIKGI